MHRSTFPRSHSTEPSHDYYHSLQDAQECWTGPQSKQQNDDYPLPVNERQSRNFLSNFSPWRPSLPSSHSTSSLETRAPHYQTVSSRRATVDFTAASSQQASNPAPLAQLPRRYSETITNLPARSTSRIGGGIKRKPVPQLAIEDDLDTVQDPLWNGETGMTRTEELLRGSEYDLEGRVRSMSLEALFKDEAGETGLGFLVRPVGSVPKEKRGLVRQGRANSSQSENKSGRSSSCDTDSGSAGSDSLPPLHTLPYDFKRSSSSFDGTDSSRASSPHPFKPVTQAKNRPFALLRRRQSRPLEVYSSIIPSLAPPPSQAKAHPKREEDLLDAWMDLMVGTQEEEEESSEEKKPALVFQSRPRKMANHPQPESIATIASILPPLRYSSASRRSSIASLPSSEASVSSSTRSDRIDVREDSEDGSDDFHDANSWTSDRPCSSYQPLEPVPESPLPRLSPRSTLDSTRFSPLVDQTNFDARLPAPSLPRFDSFSAQLLQAASSLSPSTVPVLEIDHIPAPSSTSTKRRHSRSISFDFLTPSTLSSPPTSSNNQTLPPRPPKSARRLSRPENIVNVASRQLLTAL